jgi:RsiW-degrading membrane proteinase PrsW (M82 family)
MNNILIAFLLALIPGITWLLYFLKKDVLPEPRRKILKVFLLGAIISVPVLFFEYWLLGDLNKIEMEHKIFLIIKFVFVIGLVEETFKYFVVRLSALRTSLIDEPIDIPLYMIISALGFATIENIFLFCSKCDILLADPIILTFSRFFGATLLHVLCSGIIGYFIALSFYHLKHRHILLVIGFSISIIIHATFNFFAESSIMKETMGEYGSSIFYSFSMVLILFVFFSFGLKRIKKLKSVCKL